MLDPNAATTAATAAAATRAVRYLQTAEMDAENANVTIQGPGGFRLIVPDAGPPYRVPIDANAVAPAAAAGTPGTCPAAGGVFTPSPGNYAGEYTPILRGRIVFGPQPKRFLVAILVFLVLLILFSLQLMDVSREFGNEVMAVGFSLHWFALVSFIIICANDPGVIPENYLLRELIWDTEGYRRRNPEARFYRYCDNCRGFRPPKSKHCDECQICIRDHETHLLVGGICVGQRTARSLIALSLSVGLLTLFLIIVNSVILHNAPPTMEPWRKGLAITSLVLGILLLFVPQLGVILFLFRLFLVGMGHTGSSFIHRHNDWITCQIDQRPVVRRYITFFFGKRNPSIFRKKIRQVQPEAGTMAEIGEHPDEDWISLVSLQAHGLPLINELFRLRDIEERSAQSEQWRRRRFNFLQNMGATAVDPNNNQETAAMVLVAEAARPKSIPSDPQLYSGELDAPPTQGQRYRRRIKSGVCSTLHQRMTESQRHRGRNKSPRTVTTTTTPGRRRSISSVALPPDSQPPPPVTLSDGNIPGPDDIAGVVVNTARAQQYRRLIRLVLTRDREGLMEMGRMVNIPGLLGIPRFDPDSFQFVEAVNGLPNIAPRRVAEGQNRAGNTALVSPLVASGLLPPARQLADEIERSLHGTGSVRRTPNYDRFVYETMRHHGYSTRTFPTRRGNPITPVLRMDFPVLDTDPRFLSLFRGTGGGGRHMEQVGRGREHVRLRVVRDPDPDPIRARILARLPVAVPDRSRPRDRDRDRPRVRRDRDQHPGHHHRRRSWDIPSVTESRESNQSGGSQGPVSPTPSQPGPHRRQGPVPVVPPPPSTWRNVIDALFDEQNNNESESED